MTALHVFYLQKKTMPLRSSVLVILAILVALCPSFTIGYSFLPPSSLKASTSSFSSALRRQSPVTTSLHTSATKGSFKATASSSLSMHMGHSHAHHHHHHHRQEQQQQQQPKTIGGHVLKFSRRPVARVVFAALVVFVPALIRRLNRGVPLPLLFKRTDVAAFLGISASLSFTDAIRREVQRILDRVNDWRHGFLKHAPKMELGTPSAKRMFFPNANADADEDNDSKNSAVRREQAADRVTLLGVLTNVVLSVGKLVVGVTCHSSALVADAGHSLSDLFSDFITLWAVQIARLPPDDDHPYGHGKFEAVGALFLALTLLGTGLSVGGVSYGKLMDIVKAQKAGAILAGGGGAAVKIPTFPALIMAFLSIVSKEWLYRITRRVGEDLNSQVVLANAWHHRSDAYSSILAMGSIALAMLVPGLLAADSAAGLLVGGMICMTGAEIMGEAVKQLTDASADEGLVERVKQLALQESNDVLDVQRIRTRQMGSKVIVDVAITTPESLSISATKQVEQRVRYCILKKNANIVDAEVRASSIPVLVDIPTAGDRSSNPMTAADQQQQQKQVSSSIQSDPQDHDHSHSRESPDGSDTVLSTAIVEEKSPSVLDDITSDETSSLLPNDYLNDLDDEEEAQLLDIPEPSTVVKSFQAVEDDARQLLNDHSAVRSVEGCTVHFEEASQEVSVDVTIKLENPEWTTVTAASALAKELRIVLQEGSENIHKANIYLDLNIPTPAPTDPTELINGAVRAQRTGNPNNFRTKQEEITKG